VLQLDLQAVILAAGTGTRMRPLTTRIPKALIPIANRPLLDYVLDSLEKAGVKEIAIVTGHLGWKTRRYLARSKEHSRAEIQFVRARKYSKGALFSLLAAEKLIHDDFFLIPVDLILAHEIIVKLLRSRIEENTVYVAIDDRSSVVGGSLVFEHEPVGNKLRSRVLTFGPNTRVRGRVDKGNVIIGTSVGVVLCPKEIFGYASLAARNGLTGVVDALNLFFSKEGRGQSIRIDAGDYWFDVDTVDAAISANKFILQNSLIGDKPRGKLYPDGFKSPSQRAFANSSHFPGRIIGPSIVGERCRIGDGSIIGPYVSVEHDCSIGRGVICKNSIVLGGTRIGDGTRVQNAIVDDREMMISETDRGTVIEREHGNE
jgi:NDP-sugar pyrophosphorylase family protein